MTGFQKITFYEIRPVEAELFHADILADRPMYEWMDRQMGE